MLSVPKRKPRIREIKTCLDLRRQYSNVYVTCYKTDKKCINNGRVDDNWVRDVSRRQFGSTFVANNTQSSCAKIHKFLDWSMTQSEVTRIIWQILDQHWILKRLTWFYKTKRGEFMKLISGENGLFQQDLHFLMKINILLNSVQIAENGLF